MHVYNFLVVKDLIARMAFPTYFLFLIALVHFFVDHANMLFIARLEYDKLLFARVCVPLTVYR